LCFSQFQPQPQSSAWPSAKKSPDSARFQPDLQRQTYPAWPRDPVIEINHFYLWNHHKIGINGSQKNTVDPDDTPTQEEVETAKATDKVTGGSEQPDGEVTYSWRGR
tara:strand:- start:47 stop:367 length:321 start_codon:yes stop_codon:yes gene_type:complete